MHSVDAEFIKNVMLVLFAGAGFVLVIMNIMRGARKPLPCPEGKGALDRHTTRINTLEGRVDKHEEMLAEHEAADQNLRTQQQAYFERLLKEQREHFADRVEQVDLHFNNRCGGLKAALDKHRDAHERALRESNDGVKTELKELRVEIRDEMRRIAESSAAGDLGLAQLSKDLVNAIAEIKDVTKGTHHG